MKSFANILVLAAFLLFYSAHATTKTASTTGTEIGTTGKPDHFTTLTPRVVTSAAKDDCSEVCARTYSPHTSTKGLEGESCNQGCRFFSIISATNSQPLEPCKSDCEESYDRKLERSACSLGCSSQVSGDRQNDAMFRNMENNLMRQAVLDQMMTHWMFQMISGFDWFNDMYEAPETLERGDADSENFIIVSSGDDGIHISDITIIHRKNTDDSGKTTEEPAEYILPLETSYNDKDMEQGLYCGFVNFNSNMLFCLLVFFSIMMMIWLSCNIITTTPKQTVISKKSEKMKMVSPPYADRKGALLFVAPPPVYTEKAALDRNSLI